MVNNVEFITNFAKTLEAINRLSNNDKIKYFAKIIKNGYFTDEKINNDEFEEFYYLLGVLSFRELQILTYLYSTQKKSDFVYDSPIDGKSKFYSEWDEMKSSCMETLKISDEVFDMSLRKFSGLGICTVFSTYEMHNGGIYKCYVNKEFEKFILSVSGDEYE